MLSDKVFQITLIVSFIVHGVLLTQNSGLSLLTLHKKNEALEVKYLKEPVQDKEFPKKGLPKPAKSEPFLKMASKISADKRMPPPFIDKEGIFKDNKTIKPSAATISKPNLLKPDIIAIKKKITLPPIDTTKINNPTYISYYQIVREKIKRAAYQNYTGREIGEVTVSFIVSRDGGLRDVLLMEEKSSPSAYLRGIALRSIRDASPFPVFPKELDYPQLSFNLAITFEIE